MRTKILLIATMLVGATIATAQENELPENGNVGIGTTAPSAPLDVKGEAKADSLKVAGSTTLGELKIEGLRDEERTENEVALIDPNGQILKGGELKAAVYAQAMKPCKDGNDGYTVPAPAVWTNAPGKLWVDQNCVPDAMVGIGTIPKAKLHIKTNDQAPGFGTKPFLIEDEDGRQLFEVDKTGFARGREFKLDTEVWPDYVFEENYQLMPLREIKSYILENGHLPNVATACEIEANGLNLGEMNVLLMEKVEELTLHMIMLSEKIDAQNAIIQELRSKEQK